MQYFTGFEKEKNYYKSNSELNQRINQRIIELKNK